MEWSWFILKHLSGVKKGDWIFIYHTGDEKAAVGIAQTPSAAYPDPAKKDPKLLLGVICPDFRGTVRV